jgi:hypothetical protein
MDIFLFVLMWGIAGGFVLRDYVKLSKKEKEEVLQQFKQPVFLFSDGLRTLGLILFCSGMIRTFAFLKPFGIVLLLIGWIVSGALIWQSNKKRSLVIIGLAIVFFLLYFNDLQTRFL